MGIQRMSHGKWRRVLDAFEASGYQAPMTDELFEALSHCSGDSPRLAPYLGEVERQLGRPVTEQAMRVHCLNTLRCMPREIFRYVGF